MKKFDSIIIGGGHNGLTCAAYLGKAGQQVAVVEARDRLGGFTTSEHPFSNHPDVTMPMAAMDLATANMPPSVIDDLDLPSYGLELIDIDPFYSYVAPDGTSLIFWRDLEKTCEEIARVSPADALAYRRLTEAMAAFWRSLAPYMHSHPTRPGLATILKMLGRAGSTPKPMFRAARMMMMSPKAVIESHFESPALRAALANFAAASAAPLDQPGSGIILAVMAMQHEWGVKRPIGAMGKLTDALVALGGTTGVTYITGQKVREILVENGRAVGLVMQDGTQYSANNIIGALDPATLMTQLLPSRHLPDGLRAELQGLTVFGANIASARVDFLLQTKPEMVVNSQRADLMLPTTMLIGPSSLAATQTYIAGCAGGRLGADIPVWAALPSMLDRSLTPAPGQQCLYVYVPAVPLRLAKGQSWAERRDELGNHVLAQLETVMPGLNALVLARSVRTPEDITKTSGLLNGCMYHVDMSLAQMGPWRPTPSLAGYRTPVAGLWHTGAGAHPMGSVNGISGKLAAREVLRKPHSYGR